MLPPPGLPVRLGSDVLLRDRGRTLAGGHPFHVIRLSAAGAALIERWVYGAVLEDSAAARRLAGRLLSAGVLHVQPHPRNVHRTEIDVVVPVRDRSAQLARCLGALGNAHAVIVVDDESADPRAIVAVAEEHGARVLRLERNVGPAGARNAGLAHTSAPFVAFVDSDVVASPATLHRLRSYFDAPDVEIAAPRVRSLHRPGGGLAKFEARRSSLDMGGHAGNVGPGLQTPYVPSATWLVRAESIEAFDRSLRFGEDVDLCWRTIARGGLVIYDPGCEVRHEHRAGAWDVIRTRWSYGLSIGPLARRHPDALAAMHVQPLTALAIVAALARRPLLAAGLGAARVAQLRRQTGSALALDLARRDITAHVTSATRATRRAWSPLLLAAAPQSRVARAALVVAAASRLVGADRVDPRDLPLSLADDVLAAAATWTACARSRTVVPLRPRWRRSVAATARATHESDASPEDRPETRPLPRGRGEAGVTMT